MLDKRKKMIDKFVFKGSIKKEELPGYINHYISDDEHLLVAYKTVRDYGIFTDRKVILFDSYTDSGKHKQIHTFPYQCLNSISILFDEDTVDIVIYIECDHPITLRFNKVTAEDKVRLRLLYNCISRIIDHLEPNTKDLKKLISGNIKLAFKDDETEK